MTALTIAIDQAITWLDKQGFHSVSVGIKSIDSVLRSYRRALRTITRSFFGGDVTREVFERAIADDIRVDAEDVFAEGLTEGGGDPTEMTDDERSYLDNWIENQISFVSGLGDAANESKADRKMQRAFNDRLDMWVDSMQTLGMTAKGFASANQMGQWKLGQTEKHCSTCSKLANDSPHRVSWFLRKGYIPRENGSDTLACKGFRCDCGIFSVKTGERLL